MKDIVSYILKGHTDQVISVDVNKDNTLIISGSDDETIIVWSLKNRNIIKKLYGHQLKITKVEFSNDGNYFLSASNDRCIFIWNS